MLSLKLEEPLVSESPISENNTPPIAPTPPAPPVSHARRELHYRRAGQEFERSKGEITRRTHFGGPTRRRLTRLRPSRRTHFAPAAGRPCPRPPALLTAAESRCILL